MKKLDKKTRQKWSSVANKITFSRLVSAFLLVPIAKMFENLAGLGNVSAVAFSGPMLLTDAIDGFIARKFNASSLTGSLLDKFSDKLYALAALVLITINYHAAFLILVAMEMTIFGVSLVKGANGINTEATKLGKTKTVFLGTTIIGAFLAMSIPELRIYAEYYNWAIKETLHAININGLVNGLAGLTVAMQSLTIIDYLEKDNKPEDSIDKTKTSKEVLLEIKNSLIFIKNHQKTLSDVDFFPVYQENQADVNKIKELVLKYENKDK